jgi:hypothetical protein
MDFETKTRKATLSEGRENRAHFFMHRGNVNQQNRKTKKAE